MMHFLLMKSNNLDSLFSIRFEAMWNTELKQYKLLIV